MRSCCFTTVFEALVFWIRGGLRVAMMVLAATLGAGGAVAQATPTLRLEDQNGTLIPASLIDVRTADGTGLIERVANGNAPVTPLPPGDYVFRLAPRFSSPNLLRRDEVRSVTDSTTQVVFVWSTADVAITVVDQDGAPLLTATGSFVNFVPDVLGAITSGSTVTLPATTEGDGGAFANGYLFDVAPFSDRSLLARQVTDTPGQLLAFPVQPSTTELRLEWITRYVPLSAVDQNGHPPFPGTRIKLVDVVLPASFASGDVVALPVVGTGTYANLTGDYADGYDLRVLPFGDGTGSELARTWTAVLVEESTTDVTLRWDSTSCALEVVDEAGVVVPGSSLGLPPGFGPYSPGTVYRFPVAEPSVYPDLEGSYSTTGYPITVFPGDTNSFEHIDFTIVSDGAGSGLYHMSFASTTSVPGLGQVAQGDVVTLDPDTSTWAMYFDASDVGLDVDVGAFCVRADGDLVFAVNASNHRIPGLTGGPDGERVGSSDLVVFHFTQSGEDTAGSFSFLFDGSDVGLAGGEKIDAVSELPDGDLALSFTRGVTVPGLVSADEDVLRFETVELGSHTVGSWSLLFDGSDVGLGGNGNAGDVDAVCVLGDGALLFSTRGGSGSGASIVRFVGDLGAHTSGTASVELDPSATGVGRGDVDGLHFTAGESVFFLPTPFVVGSNLYSLVCDHDADGDGSPE